MERTAVGVELFHDLADYLADRLYGFDIVLRLLVVLLQILQREPHYPIFISFHIKSFAQKSRTLLQILARVLMAPHFLHILL